MSGEVSVNVGPLSFDLSPGALIRIIRRRKDPVETMLARFRYLVEAHGLTLPQMLRLLPRNFSLTLADVKDDDALAKALNDEMITAACALFGIQREWLEGQQDQIYPDLFAYKDLDHFFEYLQQANLWDTSLQAFLLHPKGRVPDHSTSPSMKLALVFAYPIAEIGDRCSRRYIPVTEDWPYDHLPSRLHLKAIARVLYLRFRRSTVLVPVKPNLITSVHEGRVVPNFLPYGHGREQFEDYALSAQESCIACETDEFPTVLEFIRQEGLGKYAERPDEQ